MPPHCDSLDGPVVSASRAALNAHDVEIVLPYVHPEGEPEVRAMFEEVLPVHDAGGPGGDIADRLFFETVVRVHRAGESAPYTGLKPAGLDVGPVIPLAEEAIATGDPEALTTLLTDTVREQIRQRLADVVSLQQRRGRSLTDARAYVEAMLGLQVYAHHLYRAMQDTTPH